MTNCVACNIGVILGVLGWFLVGRAVGGREVSFALALAVGSVAIAVGVLVFLILPKVPVVTLE